MSHDEDRSNGRKPNGQLVITQTERKPHERSLAKTTTLFMVIGPKLLESQRTRGPLSF